MFGRIARRYDLANRLLSFGLDGGWRRRLVRCVQATAPADVLDLATGSGDVAFALRRALPPSTRVLGMDFCLPMLAEADRKRDAAGLAPDALRFLPGDAQDLPLADSAFDAATMAFGLRNMSDRPRCLAEARRVLRPGGRLFVLEFSQPRPWLRPAYYFYLRRVLPTIAGWVTADRAAYVYLNQTIEEFPGMADLSREILAAGFVSVRASRLTGGIVALHEAKT